MHPGGRRIPPEIATELTELAEHMNADALSRREIEVLKSLRKSDRREIAFAVIPAEVSAQLPKCLCDLFTRSRGKSRRTRVANEIATSEDGIRRAGPCRYARRAAANPDRYYLDFAVCVLHARHRVCADDCLQGRPFCLPCCAHAVRPGFTNCNCTCRSCFRVARVVAEFETVVISSLLN